VGQTDVLKVGLARHVGVGLCHTIKAGVLSFLFAAGFNVIAAGIRVTVLSRTVELRAGKKIHIKCGGSEIIMKENGIDIKGAKINLN
jgi:hypothetical protein